MCFLDRAWKKNSAEMIQAIIISWLNLAALWEYLEVD